MSIYLHDVPLDVAREQLQSALQSAGLWGILGVEEIDLDENALGRVLADPVWARLSSPHYHASAMDGYALKAADTNGAQPNRPVTLLLSEQTVYVDTGDALPDWANAVVPIENVEAVDSQGKRASNPRQPHAIRLRGAVPPWSHVRPMGEDIVATQLVLPAGQVLRPVDLGALAASGQTRLRVARKPRIAILPTGTELVPLGTAVTPGDIIEYNSIVLAAQINGWGGQAQRYPTTRDNYEEIRLRMQEAAEASDLVLLNAGSSAGSEDFSQKVIAALGEVLIHGVAVRPGHPVIIGLVGSKDGQRKIPVMGVPGYPVSAALTSEILVEPLISRWLGHPELQPIEISAQLTRKVTSPAGDDDYMRVAVGRVDGRLLAAPLSRGAGVITSLVHADGITIIPRGIQGLEAGQTVTVRLYRQPAEIEQTIFSIGSHDLTLDLLAQALAEHTRRLVSINVGSLGGLVALRRGEAHFAGSHLLDPETGEYNLSYIHQYLPGIPVRILTWVGREQGLLVQPGNPHGILSLQDLLRSEVTFVNRQRGAGTRVLLDYHLNQLGISPEAISGYQQEEYTHLAVAAAVRSGRADCGLGIAAAAQALELDFIPLFFERYELVIPLKYLDEPLLMPLFEIAQEPKFRQSIARLPGYDVSHMGEVIADIG